jgi:hypothetical protein
MLTAAATAVAAQADTYRDFDRIVRELTESSTYYSATFNIATEDSGVDTYGNNYGDHGPEWFQDKKGSKVGYVVNPLCTITKAVVTFGFWANDYAMEQMKVRFGATSNPYSSPFPADGQVNGYEIFEFVLGGNALSDLQADGKLDYKVKLMDLGQISSYCDNNKDNVWLKWAKLEVTTECRKVPDGGATAALLGFGLLGLAAMRRRLA